MVTLLGPTAFPGPAAGTAPGASEEERWGAQRAQARALTGLLQVPTAAQLCTQGIWPVYATRSGCVSAGQRALPPIPHSPCPSCRWLSSGSTVTLKRCAAGGHHEDLRRLPPPCQPGRHGREGGSLTAVPSVSQAANVMKGGPTDCPPSHLPAKGMWVQ